jgi:replicative DNA helicase
MDNNLMELANESINNKDFTVNRLYEIGMDEWKAPKYEMERNVLAFILSSYNNYGINKCQYILEPTDFLCFKHKQMYTFMLYLHKLNKKLDTSTLAEAYRDNKLESEADMLYWMELTSSIPTIEHANEYIKAVKDISCKLTLKNECIRINNNDSITLEDKLEGIQRLLRDLPIVSNTKLESLYKSKLPEANDNLINGKEKVDYLITQFKALDKVSKLTNGSLTVIAADTGAGKSALAQGLAGKFVLEGKQVYFNTCEMIDDELIERAQTNFGQVNYSKIINGTCTPEEAKKIKQKTQILIDDKAGDIYTSFEKDIDRLIANVTKAYRLGKVDVLIVDYIQLMKSRLQPTDTRKAITVITSSLKALALELNIPVIALSQFSRASKDAKKRAPRLSDLKESSSIEQDADNVWLLFVLTEESTITESGGHETVQLEVAKARRGQKCRVHLRFIPSNMYFQEDGNGVTYPKDYNETRGE